MTKRRVHAFGYRSAVRWLALNDDSDWARDDESPGSVTAAFVADCYGKTDSEVREDLRRALAKIDRERGSRHETAR